jgi:hypothetical protein
MVLKFAIAGEAEAANDAHYGGGIGAQTLGYGADAKENVFAGVLENGANNFLTFGAELIDALWKIDGRSLGVGGGLFHAGRGLPKINVVSTA